ncbi:MAG: hypothetical protein ACOX1P_31655 [Thermoguttaceae bacterium]
MSRRPLDPEYALVDVVGKSLRFVDELAMDDFRVSEHPRGFVVVLDGQMAEGG